MVPASATATVIIVTVSVAAAVTVAGCRRLPGNRFRIVPPASLRVIFQTRRKPILHWTD